MTNFLVSARKYRPSTFDDVIGQHHISDTLKKAISQNQISHSYLFSGPRGVGKTTCARILAKALNCKNLSDNFEPCNKCESCTAFNENNSFSIFELDAASNNSVEHIRSLNEQINFPPQTGKYKIFIIDEVHMLSTSAFNAFLKTLEEPPSYAVFILATTERHKILPTIQSRCQIFEFRRLEINDIVEQLKIICERESIQYEEDALHLLASKADGSMRDALSIFDRISTSANGRIIYADVISLLHILDYSFYFELFEKILFQNIPSIMLLLNSKIKEGFDAEIILLGLSQHIRNLILSKDANSIVLIENSNEVIEKYKQQSSLSSIDFLVTCINQCGDILSTFRTSENKRLFLELCVIKLAYLHNLVEGVKEDFSQVSEKKKQTHQISQKEA